MHGIAIHKVKDLIRVLITIPEDVLPVADLQFLGRIVDTHGTGKFRGKRGFRSYLSLSERLRGEEKVYRGIAIEKEEIGDHKIICIRYNWGCTLCHM